MTQEVSVSKRLYSVPFVTKLNVYCIWHAFVSYTDHCYHHYDDFISPKSGLLKSAWKKVRGHVPELKAQSIRLHLQCYTNAFDNPPTFRTLLCQDLSATIEDIRCKYTHLKDGYSSPTTYGVTEPLNESSCHKVKSVSTPLSPTYGIIMM